MNQSAVSDLVSEVLNQCGLELDRIEFLSGGRVVRVSVDGDGPDGLGPTLDEIAEATKEISRQLDDSDVTGSRPYTLEVSSRGVSRPLTEAKHYRRNIGRLVSLQAGDNLISGRIAAAGDDTVTLLVADREEQFRLSEIGQAVIQVELK